MEYSRLYIVNTLFAPNILLGEIWKLISMCILKKAFIHLLKMPYLLIFQLTYVALFL